MHTSAVISILLGAGALAQPRLKHIPLHHHHQRDQVKEWDEGNIHYVEDIIDVYVTEPPGQAAPPAPSISNTPLAIKQDFVRPPHQTIVTTPSPPSATPTPAAAATPAQELKYAPPQQHHQQPSHPAYQHQQPSQPAPQPQQPSSTPQQPPSSGSSGGGSTTYWSTPPKSPPNTGTDILTRANYWRSKWLSLPPFTWSPTLANNSYTTTITPTTYTTDPKTGQPVPHGESDGTVMGHILYPGSFAQCIAEGGNGEMKGAYSPFDQAFLMWICEEPNGLGDCAAVGGGGGKETGHAEIIRGGYTSIGCFWMGSSGNGGGMWTCDFSGGAGTGG